MSFFGDILGGGSQDAAAAQTAALQQGYKQASGFYGQGRDALTGYGAAALAPYTDLFKSSSAGANAYGDATGANGQPGFDRATTNFRADPGYRFQFDEGLQAIDRGAASRGMVTSGNTLNAEQKFGTGLADQSYGNYVSRLAPYLPQQTAAAGGVAGTNLTTGGAVNANYGNQGNLAYNTQVGIGNAQAAGDIGRQNAETSFLNGAVNLGTKLLGFGGGSTSFGGNTTLSPTASQAMDYNNQQSANLGEWGAYFG